LEIDRIPPRLSFEAGIQMSFGEVAYFADEVPAWIGYGVRGGFGKNLRNHRVGGDLIFTLEGPVGVHTTIGLEPSFSWNFVGEKGLLVGAGLGPSLFYHNRQDTVQGTAGVSIEPSFSTRVGWSESWTRVGRRVFVFVEPKVRYYQGGFSPMVALVLGSGGGV
jgi:hypothetical protein